MLWNSHLKICMLVTIKCSWIWISPCPICRLYPTNTSLNYRRILLDLHKTVQKLKCICCFTLNTLSFILCLQMPSLFYTHFSTTWMSIIYARFPRSLDNTIYLSHSLTVSYTMNRILLSSCMCSIDGYEWHIHMSGNFHFVSMPTVAPVADAQFVSLCLLKTKLDRRPEACFQWYHRLIPCIGMFQIWTTLT